MEVPDGAAGTFVGSRGGSSSSSSSSSGLLAGVWVESVDLDDSAALGMSERAVRPLIPSRGGRSLSSSSILGFLVRGWVESAALEDSAVTLLEWGFSLSIWGLNGGVYYMVMVMGRSLSYLRCSVKHSFQVPAWLR